MLLAPPAETQEKFEQINILQIAPNIHLLACTKHCQNKSPETLMMRQRFFALRNSHQHSKMSDDGPLLLEVWDPDYEFIYKILKSLITSRNIF